MVVSASANRSGARHWVRSWNFRCHGLTAKCTSHHECQDWWVRGLVPKKTRIISVGLISHGGLSWQGLVRRQCPFMKRSLGDRYQARNISLQWSPCLTSDIGMQDSLPVFPTSPTDWRAAHGGGKFQICWCHCRSYFFLDYPRTGRMWCPSSCMTEALRKATGIRVEIWKQPIKSKDKGKVHPCYSGSRRFASKFWVNFKVTLVPLIQAAWTELGILNQSLSQGSF